MDESKNRLQFPITINGGLLATSIAILTELMTASELDWPLFLSVVLFAVSIPLLVFELYLLIWDYFKGKQYDSQYRGCWRALSSLLSIIGLALVFWHFAWWIGILFVGSTCVTLIFWVISFNPVIDPPS